MARRILVSISVVALVSASVSPISSALVAGQAESPAAPHWTQPFTVWGHPDLQGVWANNSATPLQRPKALAERATLTDEEVAILKERAAKLFSGGGDAAFGAVFEAALADVQDFKSARSTGNYNQFWLADLEFDNRTSLITDPPDGRIPPLTPEAEHRAASAAAARNMPPAGPEDLTLWDRCITGLQGGVPRLYAGYNSYYQIFQTPDHVVILMETVHDARIVPLDGRPHIDPNIRQWLGDPRGRWEGNTLVVDTTNFSPKSNFMGSAEHLHVVERFTRVSDATIRYEVTVEDPTTWTRPWTAVIFLKQSKDRIFEYACHEGNYAMRHILAGARAEERAAEASKTSKQDGK